MNRSLLLPLSLLVAAATLASHGEARADDARPSAGYTIHRLQDDFALGALVSSPFFLHDALRVTLGGGIAWYPHATDDRGREDWAHYGDVRLVIEGGSRGPGDSTRVYGFGGPVLLLLPDRLSSDRVAVGGMGGFGFEHHFRGAGGEWPVSYFIELGGIGSGARANALAGSPLLANGFFATVGFRWYP